jgi:oligoribonuclease
MGTSTSGLLIWMDMEMTGLNPEVDTILEMATLVTDDQLNIVAEGPELIVHQEEKWFEHMDDWNKKQHTESGLWPAVLKSTITLKQAEEETLAFIKKHSKEKHSPLCGNSIWQDRRFLRRYMASIDKYLHYRNVDVSSFKEMGSRWYPDKGFKKSAADKHRALDDIRESIQELKFYRENFFIK